jgi:fermentation-respiration switch protein FrsA (DUF1100 family)
MLDALVFRAVTSRRHPGRRRGALIETSDGVRPCLVCRIATPGDARLVAWQCGHHRGPWTSSGAGGTGLGVLAYDYRGYGRSGGRPSEAGVYRDAEGAFDAVVRGGAEPGRVVCFGESLGGAVSIHLATERRCSGVAVVSTFTRLRDVARAHYGPVAFLAGNRFDSLGRVGRLRVPFFAAHGTDDDIVPFGLGERLAAAAPEPKRFLRLPGRRHNDVLGDPLLLDGVATFARTCAGS